jgi:hypothetical protein
MTRTLKPAGLVIVIGILMLSWSDPGSAHRTVVSNFTFHQDVQPILAAKCGQCHGDGGVAGLPLMRFEEARAASWPIRQALMADRMPPWSAVAGDTPLKGSSALTAREMNVLMTWAAGGTPAGTPQATAAPVPVLWPLGKPDLVLPLALPVALDAGATEADREVVLPAASLRGRWIALADLRPQTPAMVRRAQVAIRTAVQDQVISSWLPGDRPQRLEGGAAFRVPASASLVVRIRYQRPNASDRAPIADRSELGLYLSREASRRQVREVSLESPGSVEGGHAFGHDVAAAMTLVAVRQVSGPPDATAALTLIAPDGSRTPLMQMTIRPQWPRRYVFAQPVRLARGSRIEVRVTAAQTMLWESLLGSDTRRHNSTIPVSITIETVD